MGTAAPPLPVARGEIAPAARGVLELARGAPAPRSAAATDGTVCSWSPARWRQAYEIAFAERLAPLAWLRSGDTIRACAPPDVQSRWRGYVVTLHDRGERQLTLLTGAVRAMEAAGTRPIVLKGLPLAARLYGERNHWIRATADCDLFVALSERAAARSALLGDGWRPFAGSAPHEEAFIRDGDVPAERFFLELHSTLQDDRHAHLPAAAPESAPVAIGGVILRAHAGVLVPAYLAAHLAKHRLAPLLWLFDFAALWDALGEPERRASREAARGLRLGRYLAWAADRAALLAPAAAGERDALRALGFRGDARRDAHPLYRDLVLAHDPFDAMHALGAWLWPLPLRSDWRGLLRRWRSRLGKGLASYSRTTTRYDRAPSNHPRSS